MAQLAIEDLRRILIACAGEDDSLDLTGDILDSSFEDLGYDSLALMESAARIKQEYGIDLSDDDIAEVETPRALLALVNADTATAAV
ncbi:MULTISPECIES: acyl carrier protein [Streptomyces]|uniref:acyl carrier protein n=1 Tax=Streptomyces TaxID=1883 RepID=UPI00167A2735|nr:MULTISPECIES: acyl carrier protein [Streptomyces]MBK3522477.1 acyl carrier protein [Streptomyces sp. MBT70]GGR85878.1 actinorhodin polyketide synthase acyl carrier protein [Streptomyces eurythermus]